jgi:hypothetical protein
MVINVFRSLKHVYNKPVIILEMNVSEMILELYCLRLGLHLFGEPLV